MAVRYKKGMLNERRFYEGGGYYHEAKKGSCRIYIEPRGFSSGAKYEFRFEGGITERGETDTVKEAKAKAAKWVKDMGC